MPENSTNITNDQLINELKNSYIDDGQKKELEALIPEMNDGEKNELIGLIEKTKQEFEKAAPSDYKEGVQKLNTEYTKKMDTMVREESEKTRNKFEKEEKTEEAEELKEFENEIEVMPKNNKSEAKAKSEVVRKNKHTLRNIILFLIFLTLIVSGTIYALMYI